ncbi:MAG: starch-binding protein [Clostridia bacterium]|nr:starch-binding protein [Clostridia bacterium]
MQKTRKLISLLLAVMMVLSMCTVGMVSVSALPEDAIINDAEGNDASGIDGDIFGLMGDTDDNDTVNVKDATQIQKFAAKLIELDEASTALADVNLDDKVNVKDATAIQKWVAKFDVEEPINCLVYIPAAEPTTVATVPTTVAPTETTAVETKPTIPVIIPTTVATEPSEVPTTAKPTEAPATTVAPTTAKPTEAPATTVAPTTAAPTTVKPTEAPAEKVTIYFTNNQGWEVVNIYYWGGTGAASAEWPGQEMTYVETSDLGQDIYSYEIAADVAGIVFNGKESATSEKGNNYQTVDITEGIVNNAGFYPEEQKVDPEGPDNDKWICGTYTYESKEEITTEADDVVGPGYYLVGTIGGQELMTADTLTADRKLTQASNGDYVLFWTTTGGDEYKVAYYDGTEITKLFKAEGEDPYIIGKESNKIGYCKVEFNPEGKDNWSYKYMTINVTTERPDDPEDTGNQDATQKPQGEKSLILLRGDFNDWKGDDLTFYKTSDPDVVTITIELEAGKYEFKLRDRNGESLWYGNPGTIKDTTYPDSKNGWEMKETDGNCTLEATGGTYTFNFNTSTKKLTVLHNVPVVTDPAETTKADEQETTQKPQGEKSLILLRGDFNDWKGDDLTFYKTSDPDVVTITIELEAGKYEFKLRDRNGDDLWYGNPGTIKDTTYPESKNGWEMKETDGNCTLEATGGTYTFNFNTSTKKLTVLHNVPVVTDPVETTKVDEQETTKVDQQETTKVDEQETTKVDEQETTQKPQGEKSLIILRGDFNNWEGEKDTFLTTSNPDIVTVTIELEAGTYNFKLRDRSGDDLWYGNNGTIKDSTGEGGWTFTKTEGMGGHCTLEATGGTYTFNFNTSTKKLVVLHNGSVVTDPIEDNTDNDDPDVVDAGYYLVGKLNGKEYWDAASITADRKLKETSTEGEYKLNWTFYDGDQVKVVYFDGTSIKTWYKDNADNYNIDSKKAGDGVLYFRPEGNDSWSYTFFTVQPANPNESEPDSEPSSVTTDPQTSSSVAIVTDPIETESTATEPSSSSEATESQPASSSSEATESQPASSEVVDPVIPAYEVHVAEGRGFKLLGALSLAEGSKTVLEATFEFEAGNIGFKIKDADNTKWYGGATTFTDACENVVFTTSKDLATLVATGGTYKFTVDASDADNLVVKVEKIAGIDNPDEKVTIYLKQDGIDWLLNTADKRVAKLIDNDTQTEYTMSVVGDAWVVEVPSSVTDITFKRFKGDDLRNTWNAGERGTDVTYYVMDDYSGRWENQELDTYTVYFINASNWSKVCAYAWTGGTNGGGWPGKEMTETGVQVNGFDVYSVEFNAEFEKIQFNNGSNSAQIDNLTFKTGKYFDARSNEWYDTLADVPAVGALATNRFLLGDFNGWNATEYEFKLKAEGDSVGYVELELEANKTYDFKIIREGTWTSCTTFVTETVEGLQFSSSNGDNCKITTKSAGTYVFAFGLNDSKLSVTYP